jgi:hypothetical protein
MKNYVLDNLKSKVDWLDRLGIDGLGEFYGHEKTNQYDFELCYHKIIWLNDYIFRVRSYEFPVFFGFKGVGGRHKKDDDPFGDDEIVNKEVRKRTEYKIRKTVYQLANMNFNQDSRFVSLVPAENIADVQEANKYFKKFIRKMKRKFKNFKYLAVIEFQKLHREAVHYHVLWDLDYIKQKKILKVWGDGKGSVFIRRIYNVDNLGAYLLKYMGKCVSDARLFGNKAYLCSKGLKRARVENLSEDEYTEFLKKYDVVNLKPCYIEKPYNSENYGLITEVEYNLKRAKLIEEMR